MLRRIGKQSGGPVESVLQITQWVTRCYLPPGRGDIPALTPAKSWYSITLSSVGLSRHTHVQLLYTGKVWKCFTASVYTMP